MQRTRFTRRKAEQLENFEGRRNIPGGEEKKRKCTGKDKENSIANQS